MTVRTRLARAAIALGVLAVPTNAAVAGGVAPEVSVPRRDACRSWVPGNPVLDVKGVEVCFAGVGGDAGLVWVVPDASCPTCLVITTPTAGARVHPVYVRVWFANGTMVQQQYPLAPVTIARSPAVCVVDTTGHRTDCLV